MDNCPKEKCEDWCESSQECSLREYRFDEYGNFLQGYNCVRDEGLEDNFVEKNPNKYNIGDYVYYYEHDLLKSEQTKTFEDTIIYCKIINMRYWSPAHQYNYDIKYDSLETTSNENYLFQTKEECMKENQIYWDQHIKYQAQLIKEKELELKNLKNKKIS